MKKKATIWTVDLNYNGSRIDTFLSSILNISRNEAISLLESNKIIINKTSQIKKSKKVFVNDIVEITENNEIVQTSETDIIPIKILFHHDDFLIINKPPLICTNNINQQYCISNFAKSYWNDGDDKDNRYGIVHRLDKETSGALIIARNLSSQKIFMNFFQERKIKKKYIAFIEKGLCQKEGVIEFRIMRDPLYPIQMTYSLGQGRIATTHYKVIEEKKNFDIIECRPITGRTHQIRVHFQAIGFPLIGDKLYGKKSTLIQRHALHAFELSFTFKNQEYFFEAPLWEDMATI